MRGSDDAGQYARSPADGTADGFAMKTEHGKIGIQPSEKASPPAPNQLADTGFPTASVPTSPGPAFTARPFKVTVEEWAATRRHARMARIRNEEAMSRIVRLQRTPEGPGEQVGRDED